MFENMKKAVNEYYNEQAEQFKNHLNEISAGYALDHWYYRDRMTNKALEIAKNCLQNGSGRPWWSIFHIEENEIIIDNKGVFDDICDIVPGLHIGFKMQDSMEKACKKCGITFLAGGVKK